MSIAQTVTFDPSSNNKTHYVEVDLLIGLSSSGAILEQSEMEIDADEYNTAVILAAYDLTVEVIEIEGPAGGCPFVRVSGSKKNLKRWLLNCMCGDLDAENEDEILEDNCYEIQKIKFGEKKLTDIKVLEKFRTRMEEHAKYELHSCGLGNYGEVVSGITADATLGTFESQIRVLFNK